MALPVKLAFILLLFAGGPPGFFADAARVGTDLGDGDLNVTDKPEVKVKRLLKARVRQAVNFPVKLVGMSPEDINAVLGTDIYSFLQSYLVFLRRFWQADSDLFIAKFPDAVLGKYVDTNMKSNVDSSIWKGLLSLAGVFMSFGEPLGTVQTVAGWILDTKDWAEWMQDGRDKVLELGQAAPVKIAEDVTMGNLWEAALGVNEVQLVGTSPGGTEAFNHDGTRMEELIAPTTIFTPVRKDRIVNNVNEKVIWVVWPRDGALHHGWVKSSDVTPSVYMVTSLVDIANSPSLDATIVGAMKEGELFAVTAFVEDGHQEFWMELSDGRGYVRRSSHGYVGPVHHNDGKRDKSRVVSQAALNKAHKIHMSTSARCLRLAYNMGMFAAGFWTGGLTWTIAAITGVVDIGIGAGLQGAVISDLDVRLEYLLMELRSWELETTFFKPRCNVRTNPCKESHNKCVREFAFYDADFGKSGDGWCMYDMRPSRPNGKTCMVHSDCLSGNCVPPKDCKLRACLIEFTCQDLEVPELE